MVPTRWRAAILVTLLLFVSGMLSAQSNQEIDRLLAQDPAQLGHVAYLVLTAAGIVEEGASPGEALTAAQQRNLLPAEARVVDAVQFGQFSYLLTDSFGVPGGLMYRLIPGPRYAAREVVYQGWSRSRRAPGEELSGDAVARIMSVYLNQEGGAR
ncbi:MAG: hypothetical protein R6U25_01205 [Alkalispirochaeta sp.]